MCLDVELSRSGPGCSTEQWAIFSIVLLVCAFFIVAGAWWLSYKIRSCNRTPRLKSIKDETLPHPADEAEPLPPNLYVESPNGMRCCEGEYDLILEDRCNQQPYWLKKDQSRLILSGPDGHWYIARHRTGNPTDFTKVVRLIYCLQPHDGVFPHKVAGGWAIKSNFRWRVDPSIAVQAPETLRCTEAHDTLPIDSEMLQINFPDHSATACSKSLMCSMGSDVDRHRLLREMVAAATPGCNSDLSTEASSKLVLSETASWMQCSATDSSSALEAHFKSNTPSPDRGDTDCSSMSYQRTGLQYLLQTVADVPLSMDGRFRSGPGSRKVDPPAQRRLPPKLPPQALHVFVPCRQTSCSGMYLLVPGEQPNGRPLWRQEAPDPVHWLFCSTSGRWCIGGDDVRREGFMRGAGYVTQTWPSGPEVFPHSCETLWQSWDSDNHKFQEDSVIKVTEVNDPGNRKLSWSLQEVPDTQPQDPVLDTKPARKDSEVPPVIELVPSPHLACGLVGDYARVAHACPNGQPLWHKEDTDMWLYSAMDNRWYIAGSSAKLLQFMCATGEIYHAEDHKGRLPHQMQGCWEFCTDGVWVKDSGITFRAHWASRDDNSKRESLVAPISL